MQALVFCFDLDQTLCLSTNDDYSNSIPLENRINFVNELYKQGHHIIIHTARGSLTGLDWYNFTVTQLNSWKLNYHELILKKPYADFYIDDKAINVNDFEWKV